jgi:hypothetical protein
VALVALGLEEREIALSELGGGAHVSDCTSRTFGAIAFHTRADFASRLAAGRRWTVPYKRRAD